MKKKPLISVIMGSKSDWPTMKHATTILEEFKIPHEVKIVSAHRTPKRMFNFAETAEKNGFGVIIAGAGGLDQTLQAFFTGISNKVSGVKKIILEEREKQKKIKLKLMEQEKKDAQKRLLEQEEKTGLEAKRNELKEEQKLEKERKLDLQRFIKLEQAELRKERAEKQRQFLEQIKFQYFLSICHKLELGYP